MDILIIDNETVVLKTLKKQLAKVARNIKTVDNYDDAKYEIMTKKHDVVVLDHQLSENKEEKQGLDLLKEIRTRKNKTPIIVLTAKDIKEISSWNSLNSGADDFIKKPYDLQDLIARIKLAYRKSFQCKNNSSNILIHDDLELNIELGKLKIGEKEVLLGRIDFLILKKFLQYPHKLFSAEDLIEHLWGNTSLFDKKSLNSLRVHICSLKNLLGKDNNYIQNRYGYGYVFDEKDE